MKRVRLNTTLPPSGRSSRGLRIAALLLLLLLAACGDSEESQDPATTETSSGQACTEDLECAANEYCIDGACAPTGDECLSPADCDPGQACRGGFCVDLPRECEDDSGCDEGRICETFTCVPGCRQDEDCSEGQRCEDNSCIVPPPECPDTCPDHTRCDDSTNAECVPDGTCSDDSNCPGGEECNDQGFCSPRTVACARNAECPDNEYCNPATSVCESGCRHSGQCAAGQVCVDGACSTTPPECAADDSETNNDAESATPLTAGETLEDRTFCTDEDWYSITVFPGDSVTIRLDFVHDQGNLNMRLYDPDGDVLQLAGGQNDGEEIARQLTDAGTYTIQVFAANRDTYTSYSLTYTRERNCVDDDIENNDVLQTATPLVPGETVSDLFLCTTDDDWFSVDLFPEETLNLDLAFAHADGDLSLEIYDADGTLNETVNTEDDNETYSYTASDVETIYVRIPGVEDLVNTYAITANVEFPACTEEDSEDNDDSASAVSISLGETVDGSRCAGDDDWYTVSLAADLTTTITLDAGSEDPALDVLLFVAGADGELLPVDIEPTRDGTTTTVSLAPPLPGVYFIQVTAQGRLQNTYSLTVDSDAAASCPDDDAFEDNDTFEDAAAIDTGAQGGLTLCQDADWYSFELEEGQSAEVFVLAEPSQGQVTLNLFDPDAADASAPTFDSSSAPGPVQRVRVQQGEAAGTWRVGVTSDAAGEVIYSLRHFVYDGPLPLDCEFDDTFEGNDDLASATVWPGEDGPTLEAIVCEGNEDWFQIDATQGELLNIYANFEHLDGDLNLALTNAGGQVLARSESESDGEFIFYTPEASGPLYIRVSLASGEGARYDLTVSRAQGEPELACPADDSFEDNDTPDAVSDVNGINAASAILCAADNDHYGISLEAGTHLRATLVHGAAPDALALALLDDAGGELTAASPSDVTAQRIGFTAAAGQEVVLQVSSEDATAAFPYTLYMDVLEEAPSFCGSPDSQEPNTEPSDARAINAATELDNLGLCSDDEDWFEVTIPEGLTLVARADFDAQDGDLNLVAYGAQGGAAAVSTSLSGSELIVVPSQAGGRTVLVRAFRADRTDTDLRYDLSFSFEEGVLGCILDQYEPNDTDAQLAPLAYDTTVTGLTMCDDDNNDWYRFEHPGGTGTVEFVVTLDNPDADVRFDVTAPDFGNFTVGSSVRNGDRLEVVQPGVFGSLGLHVIRANEEPVSYTIETTFTPDP